MATENRERLHNLSETSRARPVHFMWAFLACVATTLLCTPMRPFLELTNIVMIFLLTVLLVAVRLGRGPAVLAAFLSVTLFDFFFVPPRFSLTVNDLQYLITFVVMLAVALITGQLTAGLRRQAEMARQEERRTRALYEIATEIAGTLGVEQVWEIARRFLLEEFSLEAVLLLPAKEDELIPIRPLESPFHIDPRLSRIAFDKGKMVEDPDFSGFGHGAAYFPLKAPMRTRGILVLAPTNPDARVLNEQRPLLATLSSLVAIAMERLHYVEVAQRSQLEIVTERLRSSILSALSHDLRTPLTVLAGLAESMTLSKQPLPPATSETAVAIRDQALRLNRLMENLLEMARLQAGKVTLRKEWQPIEEVIGSSIRLLGHSLANHQIRVELDKCMPLLEFDAVLIERVFCNLLENAAKYAPPGSSIEILGRCGSKDVEISICDRGPGFLSQEQDHLMQIFVRGDPESPTPGVGLGLAICKTIVEAHGGRIFLRNRPDGGAEVIFFLPKGSPPRVELEEEDSPT